MFTFTGFAQHTEEISVIPADEYKKEIKKKDIQLVDVRTPEEFKEGHIKGAKNIDFFSEDFITQFEALDKNEPVYIYCRSGNRSAKASKKLSEAGFKKIIDLQGGYKAWTSGNQE
ncbi:MAG TPA: rhodanese-like domain-containing protein [Salinimicrobium catena]|uniref:Rhodanese-like domain-containing protein n=1 Tax=Salinimicrobium catena TaxID=390640 RepID=A0A7C2M4M8_9FLAO|nr:rhodanese-like domain-containing protein [Salinimicrobium catena]